MTQAPERCDVLLCMGEAAYWFEEPSRQQGTFHLCPAHYAAAVNDREEAVVLDPVTGSFDTRRTGRHCSDDCDCHAFDS